MRLLGYNSPLDADVVPFPFWVDFIKPQDFTELSYFCD